jgi:hypothetical protein
VNNFLTLDALTEIYVNEYNKVLFDKNKSYANYKIYYAKKYLANSVDNIFK